MKTEVEARKCWCPYARVISDPRDPSAANRYPDGEPDFGTTNRCIASECMSWRWVQSGRGTPYARNTDYGYCGLAGKP